MVMITFLFLGDDDDGFDIGSEDFTIMMWVRRDGTSVQGGYEGIMTNSNDGSYGFVISMPADGVGAGNPSTYSFYSTGTGSYISSSLGRDIGVWHHLAFTYDSNSNFLQIYTDGSPDGSGTAYIPAIPEDIHLGNFYTGGNIGPWHGAMDDVKIYSRALSTLEIASYVNSDIRHDYGDIRFIDSDGTSLDYEMLSDGNFMVNIPSMSALETRTIHMTYGALGLESESQPLDDWLTNNGQATTTQGIDYFDEETFYDDAIAHWKFTDEPNGYYTNLTTNLNAGTSNTFSSMAIDSDGALHIAYKSGNNPHRLSYATNKSGTWAEIIIDSST